MKEAFFFLYTHKLIIFDAEKISQKRSFSCYSFILEKNKYPNSITSFYSNE